MLLRPQLTIGPDEVHVWHVLTERVREPAALQALGTMLSADEKRRMNGLRHERERTLFLLSRGLMRSVLAAYLDCSCHALQFTSNPFGKPVLCSESVHFNLSHSRGAVAFAISKRAVGIDVEERERRCDYLGLAQRYFAEPEARYLATLDGEERGAAFFALWTLKEAYVKGIGRGLTFPLDAFCFDLEACRLVAFRPLADYVAHDWQFRQFDVGERHCGALAVEGQGAAIEMRDWATVFIDGA